MNSAPEIFFKKALIFPDGVEKTVFTAISKEKTIILLDLLNIDFWNFCIKLIVIIAFH